MSELYTVILEELRKSPGSIRQLQDRLAKEDQLDVGNLMFLSGYLRAMEDLGQPLKHVKSGRAHIYYFQSPNKQEGE